MERNYFVSVDPEAEKRIMKHLDFVDKVSEAAGDRLYIEYMDSLRFLSRTPESCPLYPFRTQTDEVLRYKLFGARYRIVFRIDRNSVYVHDVQDCREDLNKSLI